MPDEYGFAIIEGEGSWREKFKSKFKEPDSLNSEQESQELSTLNSAKEIALPNSAADLVDALLADRREAIRTVRVEQDLKRKNAAINDYYYNQGKKVLQELFKECHRITRHQYKPTGVKNGSGAETRIQSRCEACGQYTGPWSDTKNRELFDELARQMREADKRAGVEWIPERY